jgi:Ser/Thr protein kinase RdoA (MazF antagonist)
MPVRDGFDRRRVDDVTELGRSRGKSLSPAVISAARDLVNDLHPGGGAVVTAVLERARRTQNVLGYGPDLYGLIHADLHQGNYLFHGDEVRVIDFDDCGWGHFAHDLAVTVSELEHLPPAVGIALLTSLAGAWARMGPRTGPLTCCPHR